MKYKNQIKSQKGSITLYVLISMMFFLFIILGIYINTSNKIQKQEKEIEKVQKEYEKEDINDIYEEIYDDYVNTETPTIQAYDGETNSIDASITADIANTYDFSIELEK